MSQSRKLSPARSQVAPVTPRRFQTRGTRSVGSPARSTASGRLSAIIQFKDNNKDSFFLSPLPARRSVLNDDTAIEEPKRRSWWKKLNENSRDVIEVLSDNKILETNEAVEEYIDIEILSQEKKNYTLELPESSDNESISSIVIPQRKLFTQKENLPQKKFAQLGGTRETLAKLHKTVQDKSVYVPSRNLINQAPKAKSKPIFPAALLNSSPNKTANKTKELAAAEVKGEVRPLFGIRPGTKRKNMFADFIVSESEDDISEIQPKVFGFQKRDDQHQGPSTVHNKRDASPTSSVTTDIEMDDWRLLPSSTMVENQFEDIMVKTPVKRPRLSQLPNIIISQCETIKSTNNSINKSRLSSKSTAKNQSKYFPDRIEDKSLKSLTKSNSKLLLEQVEASSRNQEVEEEGQEVQKREEDIDEAEEEGKDVEEDIDEAEEEGQDVDDESQEVEEEGQEVDEESVEEEEDGEKVDEKSVKEEEDGLKFNEKSQELEEEGLEIEEKGHEVEEEDEVEEKNQEVEVDGQALDNENYEVEEDGPALSEENDKKDGQEIDIKSVDLEDEDLEVEEQSQEVDEESLEMEKESQEEEEERQEVEEESVEEEEDGHKFNEKGQVVEEKSLIVEEKGHEVEEEDEVEEKNQEVEVDGQALDDENYEVEEDGPALSEENDKKDGQEIDIKSLDLEDEDLEVEEKSQEVDEESQEMEKESQEKEEESQEVEEESEEVDEESQEMEKESQEEEEESVEEEEDGHKFNEKSQEVEEDSLEVEEKGHEVEEEDEVEEKNQEVEVDGQEVEEENQEVEEESQEVEEDTQEVEAHNPDDEIEQELCQPSFSKESGTPNVSHDTTGRHRKKEQSKVNSPEVILHDKTKQMESFMAKGRNTSLRRTSIMKSMNIRPSLAPHRDSTGISDGTKNSSAEGSGWDSHRTTRKTLRQTFGKDFSPRKSLRALVMEKSAKRQTAVNDLTSVTSKFPQANSTELPEASNIQEDDVCDVVDSNHEVSKRTRQTTLEMYLQKIKKQNIERKMQMEKIVRNSLKAPSRDTFKVPTKPLFAARKSNTKTASKPKAKQFKSTLIPLDDLPADVLEDMKYKPPKRFQPSNAAWITKRLYKFLETKLEPKYDYKARLRAEKLVESVYQFCRELRRCDIAPAAAVHELKEDMARLQVVTTHFEFYQFFHEYMPREVRVKVVPDVVNKIPLPRHGVFSDILQDNAVHE